MVAPEHRAPPRRRRHRGERRGRRHRMEAAAAEAPWRRVEAGRDDAQRERDGLVDDDSAKVPSSPPTMRLRSEIGEVQGSLWRLEHLDDVEDDALAVPGGAVTGMAAPISPSSSPAAHRGNSDYGAIFAPGAEAAAKGGASTAPSSSHSQAAPAACASGLLMSCQVSVPPPPPSSSSQAASQALVFTAAAAAHPPKPASTLYHYHQRMMTTTPATRRPANANPANAPFPALAPPPQDVFERAKLLKDRFANLIAKSQQEIDDRFQEHLKSGRAAAVPEPQIAVDEEPEVVDDEETRRRKAARNAERKRARATLWEVERRAKRAALFVQMARHKLLRSLGIDDAMERIVSPERPRDGNGAPLLSPELPCCPLEKLGYFLKEEY